MDEKPLVIIYEKYHHRVFLYLYSLCRDEKLAEDLTQETFLKAVLSLENDHVNIGAWLYMVARNLYYDQFRRQKRELPMDDMAGAVDGTRKSGDFVQEDPLEQVISREEQRRLMKALEGLPDQQREVLTLQYFLGLSQREIAAIVRVSPENVRVIAYRGKRNLRKGLEAEDEI